MPVRSRLRQEDSDGEEEDGDVKNRLAKIREQQWKQRQAKRGVQAVCTFETKSTSPERVKKQKPVVEEEEEEDKQQSIGEMIESSFTGIKYMRKDDSNPHERIMEQYIREKLGSRQPGLEAEEVLRTLAPTRRDRLAMIADEINAVGRSAHVEAPRAEGVGEGAPIAYSTGIAEVALPIEVKLRNIEATDRARREMEERVQRKGGRENEPIGNLTVNYNKYRRDYANQMRARAKENTATDKGPIRGDGPSGKEVMTDDAVYDRFKKRQRR